MSLPRYLCKLSDQELRQSAARNMADLMWSTVKEPLDSALCFDKESLDLAFKYFMSPTLTMRLAGLSQITVRLTRAPRDTYTHAHTLPCCLLSGSLGRVTVRHIVTAVLFLTQRHFDLYTLLNLH